MRRKVIMWEKKRTNTMLEQIFVTTKQHDLLPLDLTFVNVTIFIFTETVSCAGP